MKKKAEEKEEEDWERVTERGGRYWKRGTGGGKVQEGNENKDNTEGERMEER